MHDPRTDHELMVALASRDRAALRTLFDRHGPVMLGLGQRILGDRHEAEDLVNEVFLEAWQRADRFEASRSAPKTYLLLMTRSRAIDRRRGRPDPARHAAGLEPANGGMPTGDPAPAETAEANEAGAIVRRGLDVLPPTDRRAIEMAFFHGLSHSQIAERCGEPLGTVKGRIRRGLMRLRQSMSRQFEGGGR